MFGGGVPVVKLGRLAGQFAKPRRCAAAVGTLIRAGVSLWWTTPVCLWPLLLLPARQHDDWAVAPGLRLHAPLAGALSACLAGVPNPHPVAAAAAVHRWSPRMASSCPLTVATSSTVRAEADTHAAARECWLGQPLCSIWPRPSTSGRLCLLLSQAAILAAWLSATLNPRSIPPPCCPPRRP